MEDDSLRFGPNGGLVFCMEYFANNFGWLEECLGHTEDDYILFDCPGEHVCRVSGRREEQEVFIIMLSSGCGVCAGQIELYTHLPVMRQLVEHLQQWEFRVCGVFLVDSQFMVESFKVTKSQNIWRRRRRRGRDGWVVFSGNQCDAQPLLRPRCSSSPGSWPL